MKKTIQETLRTRNYKRPNRALWWFISKCIAPIVMNSYGKQAVIIKDDIRKDKGPKFVLYNHQSRFDWVSAVRFCGTEPINFVIGYNEFFRSKFKLVFKLLNCIPKKNFTTDLTAIKAMTKIIKDGGTVCFAPEGMSSINGHNQPIVPGTGKFLKYFGVPIYTIKSKGAYLVNHKVCLDNRNGNMELELQCLLTPEQLKEMPAEEIDALIDKTLWEDDYEWNKEKKNHYKKMKTSTSHFEDLVYYCPKCGHEFSIKTHLNEIECTHCGNKAILDDTYTMHSSEGSIIPESLSKWCDLERAIEYERIKNDENYEFIVENCILGELPKYKYLKNGKTSVPCGKGTVKINKEGFHFFGERDGKEFNFSLNYQAFWTLVIVTDCTYTSLYLKGEYLEIIPDKPVIGKMLLMVEEFSRFYYNVWPNFPWMSHVYDGSLIEKYKITK